MNRFSLFIKPHLLVFENVINIYINEIKINKIISTFSIKLIIVNIFIVAVNMNTKQYVYTKK